MQLIWDLQVYMTVESGFEQHFNLVSAYVYFFFEVGPSSAAADYLTIFTTTKNSGNKCDCICLALLASLSVG